MGEKKLQEYREVSSRWKETTKCKLWTSESRFKHKQTTEKKNCTKSFLRQLKISEMNLRWHNEIHLNFLRCDNGIECN